MQLTRVPNNLLDSPAQPPQGAARVFVGALGGTRRTRRRESVLLAIRRMRYYTRLGLDITSDRFCRRTAPRGQLGDRHLLRKARPRDGDAIAECDAQRRLHAAIVDMNLAALDGLRRE